MSREYEDVLDSIRASGVIVHREDCTCYFPSKWEDPGTFAMCANCEARAEEPERRVVEEIIAMEAEGMVEVELDPSVPLPPGKVRLILNTARDPILTAAEVSSRDTEEK